MKKILLPTDFSQNSYNAIKYAAQLFGLEECSFFLLHTYTPLMYDSEYLLYNTSRPTLAEIYEKRSLEGLKRVMQQVKSDFQNDKHEFHTISSFNLLNDEIKEAVKEQQIDLVVMGTKGATGAEEILFGTHTVHAIKKVNCPLLAVPSGYGFKPPKEIFFPTDYEAELPENVKIVEEIALNYSSGLSFLHVYSEPELSDEKIKVKKSLNNLFEKNKKSFYSTAKKSVRQAIYDFQKDNEVDLLVMLKNKHSFLENLFFKQVIDDIGFHVKVPFLVLPALKKA